MTHLEGVTWDGRHVFFRHEDLGRVGDSYRSRLTVLGEDHYVEYSGDDCEGRLQADYNLMKALGLVESSIKILD